MMNDFGRNINDLLDDKKFRNKRLKNKKLSPRGKYENSKILQTSIYIIVFTTIYNINSNFPFAVDAGIKHHKGKRNCPFGN